MITRPILLAGVIGTVLALAISAWAWGQIPDSAQLPIHWGLDGTPDGFAPKGVALAGLPLLILGIGLLLAFVPRVDPRAENLARSATAYRAVAFAAIAFLVGIHGVTVAAALGMTVNMPVAVGLGIGMLFVVIGNYLGKTRSSWTFGIRTPWTLSSEQSWDRTHRLGGYLFMGLGALIIGASALAPELSMWAMLAGTGVVAVVLVVYSYMVWRDDRDRTASGARR